MIANTFAPKWSKSACILALAIACTSCNLLGSYEIDSPGKQYELKDCSQEQALQLTQNDIRWELSYLGPAKALSTSKNLWGAHTRYVVPYSSQTDLYQLSIANFGSETLWLDPNQIELSGPEISQKPLDLNFFKRIWPSGPVQSQNELMDRSLALSEVMRTLFVAGALQSKEKYVGILAFPRVEAGGSSVFNQLKISNWQYGAQQVQMNFCLNWQKPSH